MKILVCEGSLQHSLSVRELRKILEADKRVEQEWISKTSCTSCGKRCVKVAYDGWCGRRLCRACAKVEGMTKRIA